MRPLIGPPFDAWRDCSEQVRGVYGSIGDETCGVFRVQCPYPSGHVVTVIASRGGGWDHVSVSRPSRCPTWDEMVFVKRHFFRDDEWAVEYHPAPSANINVHPYTLHLWRPTNGERIATPPDWMVGYV